MTYAAIQATFSDFKITRGRKVAVLIFEVPLEKADDALKALGGVPQVQTEVFCAIARLDMKKASEPEKTRRKFNSLPIPTRIGIVCNEPIFWRYLTKQFGQTISNEGDAAEFVRFHCGVQSRSEIKDGTTAYMNWHDLFSDYETYKLGQPF